MEPGRTQRVYSTRPCPAEPNDSIQPGRQTPHGKIRFAPEAYGSVFTDDCRPHFYEQWKLRSAASRCVEYFFLQMMASEELRSIPKWFIRNEETNKWAKDKKLAIRIGQTMKMDIKTSRSGLRIQGRQDEASEFHYSNS